MQKTCAGYAEVPAHDLEWDSWNFPGWALKPERAVPGRIIRCKPCDKYRRTKYHPLFDPVTGGRWADVYGSATPAPVTTPIPQEIEELEEEEEEYFPEGAELEELKPEPQPEPEPEPITFDELRFDRALVAVVEQEEKPKRRRTKSAETTVEEMVEASEEAEVPAVGHRYIASKDLLALWHAVTTNTLKHGRPPATLVFFGPSGSGKTSGAEHLADLVALAFTKIDAASMTDPEAWFGTREIVIEQGVAVTKYIPSRFVESIQRPGVTFIDEMTRVDDEHRNVLLPLTDGTGVVTNPLTGEIVVRHPHNFIIMAGNRGLHFTGTSAVDPAFTSRSYVVEFDYLDPADEKAIVIEETGCDEPTAEVFTRFAQDTRDKARVDPEFIPISTREVIMACEAVKGGLDRDLAAAFAVMNAISAEGGDSSRRSELEGIWNGVRITAGELEDDLADDDGWKCPTHGKMHVVQAGVSKKTGKPYNAFRACPEPFCDETEGRKKTSSNAVKVCTVCATVQPQGRTTFCTTCGAALP